MYCPSCGAEYRAGFTTCSDCQVELVSEPAGAGVPGVRGAPSQSGGFALIWSGANPQTYEAIREALEHAGIDARTIRAEEHLILAWSHARFEIWVPVEEAEQARELLQQLGSGEESGPGEADASETPAEGESPEGEHDGDERAVRARGVADPDAATAEAWPGGDAEMGEMIRASLRENGIYFSAGPDKPDGPEPQSESEGDAPAEGIFVLPEDEARAKEIVREIVEGTPLT
jgi:hypothetical protein